MNSYHGLKTQHSSFPLGYRVQSSDISEHIPPHVIEITLGEVCIVFNREVVTTLLELGSTAFAVASTSLQREANTETFKTKHSCDVSVEENQLKLSDESRQETIETPQAGVSATFKSKTHGVCEQPFSSDTRSRQLFIGLQDAVKRKLKLTASMSLLDILLVGKGENVARASLKGTYVRVDVLPKLTCICSRLCSLSLQDLTPFGFLYRDVFSTIGDEVLSFNLNIGVLENARNIPLLDETSRICFRQDGCPDLRYTTTLRICMASIRYVHTRRFVTIMQNYISQFHKAQVMAGVQTAAKEMVQELKQRYKEELMHINIEVDTPIVVIPRNSFSPHVIEAYLGKTIVTHGMRIRPPGRSIKDGTSGITGSFHEGYALVDCLLLDVRDVRLVSAVVVSHQEEKAYRCFTQPLCSSNLDDSDDASSSCSSGDDILAELQSTMNQHSLAAPEGFHHLHSSAHPELLSDCHMKILFEQNMTLERRDLPMVRLECCVSNVNTRANPHQFDLVLSILDENLGCETELLATQDLVELSEASKVVAQHDDISHKWTISDRMNNPDHHSSEFQWIGLEFELKLENVHIKLFDTNPMISKGEDADEPLTELHLLQSALSFSSYTDGTLNDLGTTVRLYSTAIAIEDMIPDTSGKQNLYRQVLTPACALADKQLLSDNARAEHEGRSTSETSLHDRDSMTPQLEIAFTMKPQHQRLHILLSRTRLVISPEWASRVITFAISRPESGFKQVHASRQPLMHLTSDRVSEFQEKSSNFIRFTLNINDPELILVDDVTSSKSEALVVKVCNITNWSLDQHPRGDDDSSQTALVEEQCLELQMEVQISEFYFLRYIFF